MSETQETAEAAEETPVEEFSPEPPVAPGTVALTEDQAAAAAEDAPEPEADVPVVMAAPAKQANVFLCERGHRTASLWSTPSNCHARPTRSGPECGRQLYPVGQLPEQVQKALNPLKASKKSSKG